MKKSEAMEIQKRYGMEILRNPVTSEAWAVYMESPECIRELDDLAATDLYPCEMVADYGTQDVKVTYKLICPTAWFDLYGWRS